ncbi:hydantoinase/oxoprolinase family protein [Sphingobium sp.]|uniref:hydantoinase/oxoprolinase family protein n=1 Tax=Sphingobium sp. TaxID=1912891 RepID=UPI002CD27470|nr:hydantoinase/oxoprolinase family protein [Sphingobium sp.]HUD92949.1 hydantoinase/oxoprolinase family protein [Sphingobium sp.]
MGFVIGIDVGGTFTDVVCSDGQQTWRAKSPTNPQLFAEGVLKGCLLIAEQVGRDLSDLLGDTERFGLGTTAVTNVLATKRGHRVGLLTTAGFENELHTARNKRVSEDGWLTKPWNPVERTWIRGIDERIDRDGKILKPLDADEIRKVVSDLTVDEGVNAFAISFLWSFKNPEHERLAADIVRAERPDLPVFLGSELHPLMREYERTTLAVLNAFTATALDGVEDLETQLRDLGLKAPVLLLHSGGGAISVKEARATPIALASSGPAAGAVAAAEAAVTAGMPDVLCCDMGGTSVDVAVVRNGVPERRQRAEIEGIATAQSAVDVESIGSGGGSIAWIDSRGLLRVGPQSARATPGPVCYGRGGTEPTVTDAMVLLGYIDPASFMGGRMTLDVEAAREACARLGSSLGMNAIEVAYGIREIALAEMGKALRARIASGGIDIRKFGVVAFGGSGSLFATAIAQDLGAPVVLTPTSASVLSAYGAATADIRRERMQSIDKLLPLNDDSAIGTLQKLLSQVDAELEAQGVSQQDRSFICEADMRFYRQKSELTIAVESSDLNTDRLIVKFREIYTEKYGANSLTANTPIELSTLRVIGIGRTIRASLPSTGPAADTAFIAPTRERPVWVERAKQQMVPVYDTNSIKPGHVIEGPALLDAGDTTIWAPPRTSVTVAAGRTFLTHLNAQSYRGEVA